MMHKFFLIAFLSLVSAQAAFADDEETDYLPIHAVDVTKSQKESGEIKKMAERFVKAVEGRDAAEFDKLTTADFREQSDLKQSKLQSSTPLDPKLLSIHDFFIMKYKDRLYLRFSVRNQNGGRLTFLPSGTWYEVKKDDGVWKMSFYWAQFDPDGGP